MRQKVKNRVSKLKLGHFTVASLHQKKKQVLLIIKTLDQKPVKLDNGDIRS